MRRRVDLYARERSPNLYWVAPLGDDPHEHPRPPMSIRGCNLPVTFASQRLRARPPENLPTAYRRLPRSNPIQQPPAFLPSPAAHYPSLSLLSFGFLPPWPRQ
jgi:hypothetical protein